MPKRLHSHCCTLRFVRTLAAQPKLCTAACEFYRAEAGFLLQVTTSCATLSSRSSAWDEEGPPSM